MWKPLTGRHFPRMSMMRGADTIYIFQNRETAVRSFSSLRFFPRQRGKEIQIFMINMKSDDETFIIDS